MTIRSEHIKPLLFRTLFVAGVLFLGACSADAPLEPTPVSGEVPISFAGNLPEDKEVTRAVGLEDKATTFKVWSYKEYASTAVQCVMPGFTVSYTANTAHTTTSNSADWEYVGVTANQEIKYWDLNAQAYRFFGYAPHNTNLANMAINGTPATSATLSVTANATSDGAIDATPYFTEMWYNNNIATVFQQPVTLVFVKPYARVRFMFTFVDDDVKRSDISNQRFAPSDGTSTVPCKGTFNINYPLSGGTRETYSVTNIDNSANLTAFTLDYYESTDDTDTNRKHWYTVIPPTSQGSYTLTAYICGDS